MNRDSRNFRFGSTGTMGVVLPGEATSSLAPKNSDRLRPRGYGFTPFWKRPGARLQKHTRSQGIANFVRDVARRASEDALRRTDSARRIDLIKDLATPATYAIIREVYGVRAPEWLTEISAAMRFARQHVGDLPSDWLAKLAGREPHDRGVATLQTWSASILADLIGNAQSLQHLKAFSRQAGSEMLNHLDQSS